METHSNTEWTLDIISIQSNLGLSKDDILFFFFGSNLFSVAIIGSHELVIIEVANFSVPPKSSLSC